MAEDLDGSPRMVDAAGRTWTSVFGRWTPMADDGGGNAGVPARVTDGPPPRSGTAAAGTDRADRTG